MNFILGDFQILARGGTIHPFFGANGEMNKFVGVTFSGRIDKLDFNLIFGGFPLISQNYWLASFPGQGIRVYDPADELRFVLPNEQWIMFDEAFWDTNAQGIFYQTWVDPKFEYFIGSWANPHRCGLQTCLKRGTTSTLTSRSI